MAAHAVQLLTPFVKNYVMDVPGSIVVPTPFHVDVPPLQTFTFIPVTGKVIARTIASPCGAQSGSKVVQASSSSDGQGAAKKKEGPGSASGADIPKTPKSKGNIVKDDDEEVDMEEAGGEEDEDAGDGEDGNDLDKELAALEQGEAEAKTKKEKKKKAGSEGGSAKKKARKSK